MDLVVVEGFKHEAYPKIEIHRPSLGNPLLHPDDPHMIAVVSDEPITSTLPILDLNNPEQIVDFIMEYFSVRRVRGMSVKVLFFASLREQVGKSQAYLSTLRLSPHCRFGS